MADYKDPRMRELEQSALEAKADKEKAMTNLLKNHRLVPREVMDAIKLLRDRSMNLGWRPGIDKHVDDAHKVALGLVQNTEAPEPHDALVAAVEALNGILAIVGDSHGVAGWHLNGDIADWREFEEIDAAYQALARLEAAVGDDGGEASDA